MTIIYERADLPYVTLKHEQPGIGVHLGLFVREDGALSVDIVAQKGGAGAHLRILAPQHGRHRCADPVFRAVPGRPQKPSRLTVAEMSFNGAILLRMYFHKKKSTKIKEIDRSEQKTVDFYTEKCLRGPDCAEEFSTGKKPFEIKQKDSRAKKSRKGRCPSRIRNSICSASARRGEFDQTLAGD
jgi:hypothetical protein